jgi:hypothetical protein
MARTRVRGTCASRRSCGINPGSLSDGRSRRLNYTSNARILAELGTRRMDNITLLDVRVEKLPPRGARSHCRVRRCLRRARTNPEQNTNWSSGPSFLRPLSVVPPRLARLGLTLEW